MKKRDGAWLKEKDDPRRKMSEEFNMRGRCAEDVEHSCLARTEILSQEMMKNESQGRIAQGALVSLGRCS